jgi:ketosteroid isomerase-like protein
MSNEPTTPDLAELTRRFVEAWNRRDLDAWAGFFAPDAVWEVPALDTRVEGVATIRSFGEEWLVAFAEYAVQPEEILDLGNGVVFAATRQNVRPAGVGGGAVLQEVWVYVFVWVEGMLVRSTIYRDPDEGRAAAERLAEERG